MKSGGIFRQLTAALDQAQIPYMVVGSFASNLYGTARGTQDIDVVISATAEQVRQLLKSFPEADYYFDVDAALEACRRKSMFNVLDMERGWKVDFIFAKSAPYHRQAFDRRTSAEIEDIPLLAATAEDTIIAKLEWGKMGASIKQIEDVVGILKVRHTSLDLQYIENWVKELELASEWNEARQAAGLIR